MEFRAVRALIAALVTGSVVAAVLPAAASTAGTPPASGSAIAPGRSAPGSAAVTSKRPLPVVVIDTRRRGPAVSKRMLGSNHRFPYAGYGTWNRERDRPVRAVVRGTRRAGISMLRYPGGSKADMFDWKEAIGPIPKRGCMVQGRWGFGSAVRAVYGVDEHMQFARAAGAETVMMVPIATERASDAADWVEYMNTPVGRNPNGGRAWAKARAAHGHRAPYDVRRWTVGNEPYLLNQRFWMSQDNGKALRQYVEGGQRRFRSQRVGKGCELPKQSRAARFDRREILYPPVTPDDPVRVTVNGHRWHRVKNWTGVGPNAHAFVLDFSRGKLTFGNNTHGAGLPPGAKVRASYTSAHPGFVQVARAMKQVDPDISVCSEWGQPAFIKYMRKRSYDCVAAHPYKMFQGSFADRLDAHDKLMAKEKPSSGLVDRLRKGLVRHGHGRVKVTVTEFGTISLPDQPDAPAWDLGMSAALFKASQLVRFARRGVPWATGGALTSHGLRSTLGTAPHFTSSAWAVIQRQIAPALHAGGHIVPTAIRNGINRPVGKTRYGVLTTMAVKRGSKVWVVVVNRAPRSGVTARLRLSGGTPRKANARVATAPHLWTYNTPKHPYAVHGKHHRVRLRGHFPKVHFPKHSVTVLRMRAR